MSKQRLLFVLNDRVQTKPRRQTRWRLLKNMKVNELNHANVGGIEAGGTHYKCVVGNVQGDILASTTFATTSPQETAAQALAFFDRHALRIQALAIGHFGPVDVDPGSRYHGHVLSTPKAGWSGDDVLARYQSVLSMPIVFQSDGNVAAVGEHTLGAAKGLDNFVYVTVGTGIGGGVMINGRLLHDARHPEIGHMLVRRHHMGDDYQGCCPFHGDCLEGLASGPALRGRWGISGEQLPPDHPAWTLQAHYLAAMCVNLTTCYAPQRIILGGGAMQQPVLPALIREQYTRLMNGYMQHGADTSMDDFIVVSPMQGHAATRGALILAAKALSQP